MSKLHVFVKLANSQTITSVYEYAFSIFIDFYIICSSKAIANTSNKYVLVQSMALVDIPSYFEYRT